MKPGLRKVAALILATATMFGGGALSASTALADDLTVDSSTQVQADTSNSGNADTNSGNTQSDITGSSNADSQTQSDVHADTSIRAQSAPEDAKDVTIHDMLDTDTAYVSKLKLTDRVTGTAPFDNDNERGDDKDASNDIVRSFDDVIYDYDYTVTPDSTMDYYKRTRVGFHFELPYPADKVTFDTDQMGWVDQTPGYQPKLTTETINGVKTQVYTCYRLLEPTSNSPTVNPGTSAIQLAVKVKAAPHGYKFRPTVQAWTAWNKNNPTDTGTHKAMSDTPKDVTVSAKLNLNISLQYQITGGGTYDFNTGDATAPNKGKGKIQGRQLHVLVRTAMRWKDRSKGLKGIEVPTGSIGYKLNVSSVFQDDDDKHAKHAGEKQWQPILWDRIHQTTTYKWNGKSTHNRKCDSFDHNGSFPSSITVDKESVNDGTTVYDDGTITDKGTTVNVSFTGYDTLNYPCANAGQYTSFGKCSTAYMDGSLTQQQVAALHVDEFTFILPTATTDGKTAAQYYGKDQTGNVTITDTALSATSVSGMTLDTSDTNTNQSVADDDLASGNWTVRLPGAFIQSMYYTNASTRTVGRCDNATTGRWQDAERYKGSDRVLENTKFGIVTAAENKLNSTGNGRVLGVHLVKWDPDILTPLSASDNPDQPYTVHDSYNTWGARFRWSDTRTNDGMEPVIWGVLPNGVNFSTDTAQAKADYDDFDWYPTYAQAAKHGKVLAAQIIDTRVWDTANTSYDSRISVGATLPMQVNDKTAGRTAQTTGQVDYWTRNDLAKKANLDIEDDLTTWTAYARSITGDDYTSLVKQLGKPSLHYDGKTYLKATFSDDGVYQGGDTGGNNKGDTLYVVGERPAIGIHTSQKDTANTVSKTIYDLDKEQRHADWVINATAKTGDSSTGGDYLTDYHIKVTLPKGLTYTDGSSTVGGEYKDTDSGQTQGVVTGGTPVTPTVTPNKDGTTTLEYTVNGVKADGTDTLVRFSTTIGEPSDPETDAKNNQQYTVNTEIRSKRWMGTPSAAYGQTAAYTIRVSRTHASSLATRAKTLLNETQSNLGFVNMLGNFSRDAKPAPYAVDIMPYKGLRQSDYHGEYTLTGLSVKAGAGASMSGVKVYFTTDPKWRNVDATKITREQVEQWTEAKVDATTGKVVIPDGCDQPVAWAFTSPSLPANARYDFTLGIKPTNNSAGDVYMNRWADGDNKVDALTQIVERKVNGVAWFDVNHDGIRQDSDRLLSDVTVTLLDKKGKTVTSVDGKPCATLTDKNGRYEIGSIPAGSGYKLRFTPKTGITWHGHHTTVKNAKDASEATDSDSDEEDDADGNMIAGVIPLKDFPALNKMTAAIYEDLNEDHGIYGMVMPTVPVAVKAVKVLNGRPNGAWTEKDKYVADITPLNNAPKSAVPSSIAFTDNKTQTVRINTGAFTQEGTYQYEVKERKGDNAGVTYDDRVWILTVTVTDDLNTFDRHVTANVSNNGIQSDTVQFTNTYAPKDTQARIVASKLFTNADQSATKITDFQFDLYANDKATGTPIQTVNASADGKVEFSPLLFTKAKLNGKDKATFSYSVRERNTGAAGVKYDDHYAIWTVTVTDDNSGQLKAQTRTNAAYPTTFTNTYQAKPVSVQFRAHKTLNDPDHTGIQLQAGQYEFKCVEDKTGGQAGTVKTNDQQGNILFDTISYKKTGVYDYTLSEVHGDRGGVTYDATKHHVKVTVTDNGEGQLLADVKYDNGTNIPEFTNTYHAQPATDNPTAVKKMTSPKGNKYTLKGEDFAFTLQQQSAPANVSNADQTKRNDRQGNIRFDQLSFPLVGTYVFTMSEQDTTVPGVTKDGTVATITYVVKDVDHTGKLTVVSKTVTPTTGANGKNITFTNHYSPKNVGYSISGVKNIVNTDTATSRVPQDGEFKFQLNAVSARDADGNAISMNDMPMPVGSQNGTQTVSNKGSGFTFGQMVYTMPGVYTYHVKELAGTDKTIGYSTQEYDVTVTVTDQDGMLAATADRQTNDIRFDNTYTPTPVSVRLEAAKHLTGRDLNDNEFSAELKDSNGNLLQAKQFARVPRDAQSDKVTAREGDGTLEFDKLTFDKTGVYTYTVDEQDGTLGGVAYDTTSHTVTITVAEDTKSHKLAASVAYFNGKASEKSILFQNTYQPEDVLVELSAKKNLTGRELQASEFKFELVDDKGNVIDSEKNDKQGNIQFKPLTYSRDNDGVDDCGEYRYVIREKNTGEKNVTYDKTEHHVTVTVSDNLQGNLTAKVQYDPTNDSAKDSSTMPVTPTDKADKTDENAGEDENNPTATPSMVTTTGTRPEFTNSYIPPATPAIVKTIRQLAQTGVNTPIMAVILFTLMGMGLILAHRRGNTTVTARHKK